MIIKHRKERGIFFFFFFRGLPGIPSPARRNVKRAGLGQGQPELLARGQNEDNAMAHQRVQSANEWADPPLGLQGGSEGLQDTERSTSLWP